MTFFRVTSSVAVNRATSELAQQTAELQRTQEQISTGRRLNRPSDDPTAVRRAIVQQDQLSRLETHVESVQLVQSRVSQAHVQLREAQQLFVRARTTALTGVQETEPAAINALATEVDGILNALVSLANSSDENGFLFSGAATTTEPFTVDRETGRTVYAGSNADSQLYLTGDVSREALVSGNEIFGALARESTLIVGTTGIQSGNGADTAIGVRSVTVGHTSTTYAAGSGVAPGTDTANDTIIGQSGTHQLLITDTSGTGAFGTVSLNGGQQFDFTSADTNLVVTGPNQERVHLDLSSITAGFSGTVDIVADGTLSLDGGVTTQPINFSGDEQVVDPADGSVIYFDTTGITTTGTDSVELEGTSNAFQTLISLRDDLLNTRDLPPDQRAAALQRRLGDIERVEAHLLDEIGLQSVALEQLERLQVRTEDQSLEQQIALQDTTTADLAEAAVRLQELLTLQEFTISAIARVQSQNLLDFLQ